MKQFNYGGTKQEKTICNKFLYAMKQNSHKIMYLLLVDFFCIKMIYTNIIAIICFYIALQEISNEIISLETIDLCISSTCNFVCYEIDSKLN